MATEIANLLQRGLECHNRGQFDAAKMFYDQVLAINPRHPDGLHLSGLIAHQNGQIELALERLRKAAQAQPKNAMYRGNLANALAAAGMIEEAQSHYQRAAKLAPNEPQFALGIANCLAMMKRFAEAEAQFRSLTARFPNIALGWFNYANVVRDQNRVRDSIALYERAIEAGPAQIEPYINLGGVLLSLGKFDAAESTYRKALTLDPDDPRLLCNLASVLIDRGQFADAEAACRRAVAIDPKLPTAHSFLGAAVSHQGRLEEALAHHRQAAMLEPANVRAQTGYGAALSEVGRIAEAVPILERAIALAPDRWESRVSLGNAQLALGHFREGWAGYAHRVHSMNLPKLYPGVELSFELPRDLSGKHVVLLNEQGLGDQLYFLRFAEQLRQRGARLTCKVTAKIASLVSRVPVFDQVVPEEAAVDRAEYAVLVGDLPRLTGHGESPAATADASRVPPPLKLSPLPEHLAEISALLAAFGPPPYLGLTWRGGTAPADQKGGMAWNLFKQISLEQLTAAVQSFPGTFVILQRRPADGEIAALTAGLGRPALDLNALNEDLERMLAVLALLNDYVGVSNTNMHLRAGVDKTSRVLVPCPPDWRWMAAGEQSPWFPGCGVYRQKNSGDWSEALGRLADDIRMQWTSGRR